MSIQEKIKSRSEVCALVEEARKQHKRVCLAAGVFDLLHPGHADYLEQAARLADLLVVGVNSDESVRAIKGEQRPIRDEAARAASVAALASVDFVFVFEEKNSRRNVELLRPEVYAKGSHYLPEQLSSVSSLAAYGGRLVLIPITCQLSTTGTVNLILERYGYTRPAAFQLPPPAARPAVFLDRDGTINEHVDYLHDPQRFRLLPGALSAVKRLREAGYYVVIITNQPGIGTGYFSEDDFFRVNKVLLQQASRAGALIDRVYFCPHSVGALCQCRKPRPGMIERAVRELNIRLEESFVIGDMTSDIELGRSVGCRTVLVETGRAGKDGLYSTRPDFVVPDLAAAADLIVAMAEPASLAAE